MRVYLFQSFQSPIWTSDSVFSLSSLLVLDLSRAGVLGKECSFLYDLVGVLSTAVENPSDVADSRCIQSHRSLFPIKSCGTLS